MTGFGHPRLLSAAVLLLLAAGLGRADPIGLLRAAEKADQHLNYVGVQTLGTSGGDESTERRIRISHLAPDQTRIEFLSPDGGGVLLERGSYRWYYSPHHDRWRSIEWHPQPEHLALLLRNYQVRRQGNDMVAGRRVVVLSIEPRYPGNPRKRVWIDPTCRMVLREEIHDYRGRLIASSRFEQFEPVSRLPAELFTPPAPPPPSSSPQALLLPPLRPRYLPPGYHEVQPDNPRPLPHHGVYLRYTDGLGTISLFQFHDPREPSSDRRHHRREEGRRDGRLGARDSQNKMTRDLADRRCVLMGSIAPDELRKVLDSLPSTP
jgi:outer membrane lipoprotein-sorting protein